MIKKTYFHNITEIGFDERSEQGGLGLPYFLFKSTMVRELKFSWVALLCTHKMKILLIIWSKVADSEIKWISHSLS